MVFPSAGTFPPTTIFKLSKAVEELDDTPIALKVLSMVFARMVMFRIVPAKLPGVTKVV